MEFLILLYAKVYFPCFKFLHYYALTGLREISVLCSPGFDGHPRLLTRQLEGQHVSHSHVRTHLTRPKTNYNGFYDLVS